MKLKMLHKTVFCKLKHIKLRLLQARTKINTGFY